MCANTNSGETKKVITPNNGFFVEGWQLHSLRQAQFDKKYLMLVTKDSCAPIPAWNQVSSGSGIMKTVWWLWNRQSI